MLAKGEGYCQKRVGNIVSQERVILSAKGGKYCQLKEGTVKSRGRKIL
jgi:hypothetical protein